MNFLSDGLMYALIVIFGLILGSYLNSWIWRIHEGKYKFGGRSVCVHCGRKLAWYENIPLASFLALRGKCRTCRQPIPADYFLVELGTALLFVGLTYFHLHQPALNGWHFFRDLFFTALLIVIFIYDLKYQEILTGVVWAGTIVAFAFQFVPIIHNSLFLIQKTQSILIGVIVGGGFFLLQYVVSNGRWIGGGDVRLGVLMGALLGWPQILVAIFISYILGALVAVPLLVSRKKNMNSAIPFGTFLAIGTFVTMMWGNEILSWYLNFLR